jgi:hypothetical protein
MSLQRGITIIRKMLAVKSEDTDTGGYPGTQSLKEQAICVTCGFCCDGTLFNHAVLDPGEKEFLPEKIKMNYLIKDNKEYFRLPCSYFAEKCTIYNQKKAIICSAFRCKLLRDFAKAEMTMETALKIIVNAEAERKALLDIYYSVSENPGITCFKQLLSEISKDGIMDSEFKKLEIKYNILIARCNIFEALLTRHFRSTKEFNDLMETSNEDNQTEK